MREITETPARNAVISTGADRDISSCPPDTSVAVHAAVRTDLAEAISVLRPQEMSASVASVRRIRDGVAILIVPHFLWDGAPVLPTSATTAAGISPSISTCAAAGAASGPACAASGSASERRRGRIVTVRSGGIR